MMDKNLEAIMKRIESGTAHLRGVLDSFCKAKNLKNAKSVNNAIWGQIVTLSEVKSLIIKIVPAVKIKVVPIKLPKKLPASKRIYGIEINKLTPGTLKFIKYFYKTKYNHLMEVVKKYGSKNVTIYFNGHGKPLSYMLDIDVLKKER